jgi:hypothetical protein
MNVPQFLKEKKESTWIRFKLDDMTPEAKRELQEFIVKNKPARRIMDYKSWLWIFKGEKNRDEVDLK